MSLRRAAPRCAPPRRVLLTLAATALVMLMTNAARQQTRAQDAVEGTVWLSPAISMVPADGGAFTVFAILQDLRHFGALSYDDNRDTVPDRQVPSTGLGAFEVTIRYDEQVLRFVAAEEGPDLGSSGRSFYCLPPALDVGRVSFGCVSPGPQPSGPQGTMTLAAITFEPIGAGASPLVLEADLSGPLGADTVPVEVRGGVARVSGQPAPKETVQAARATPTAGSATSAAATANATGTAPTVPATPGASPQPGGTDTSGGHSEDLVTGEGGPGSPDGSPASGGGSAGGTTLWFAVGVGGACAAALLTLMAVFEWRRRARTGT